MSYRTVSVEVCLSEFSDEEIVDEVRDRELQGRIHLPSGAKIKEIDVQGLATDVQSLLVTRRYDKASAAMQDLLATLLPPAVAAAFDAIKDGRYAEAICELDDFISPPPSATATMLPKKPAPLAPIPTIN